MTGLENMAGGYGAFGLMPTTVLNPSHIPGLGLHLGRGLVSSHFTGLPPHTHTHTLVERTIIKAWPNLTHSSYLPSQDCPKWQTWGIALISRFSLSSPLLFFFLLFQIQPEGSGEHKSLLKTVWHFSWFYGKYSAQSLLYP